MRQRVAAAHKVAAHGALLRMTFKMLFEHLAVSVLRLPKGQSRKARRGLSEWIDAPR